MRIYLSGKISGLSETEYKENFKNAALNVYLNIDRKHKIEGLMWRDIINPLDIKPLFGINKYWFFMAADLYTLIFKCDTIFLLPNWNDSKGAKIELCIALLTNKTILK